MTATEKEQIITEVFELYDRFGEADYIGEPVSQIEHMSQAAELALENRSRMEVVLAAFLHEAIAFEQNPLVDDLIQLRIWDEMAKETGRDYIAGPYEGDRPRDPMTIC